MRERSRNCHVRRSRTRLTCLQREQRQAITRVEQFSVSPSERQTLDIMMDGGPVPAGQPSDSESPRQVPAFRQTNGRVLQAACLACRGTKTKCYRDGGDSNKCRRCDQLEIECVIPPFRVGRRKGARK